jgi:hypothetical protein
MAKLVKWLVALVVAGGIVWFLQARNGERPITRIEKPVSLNDLK